MRLSPRDRRTLRTAGWVLVFLLAIGLYCQLVGCAGYRVSVHPEFASPADPGQAPFVSSPLPDADDCDDINADSQDCGA